MNSTSSTTTPVSQTTQPNLLELFQKFCKPDDPIFNKPRLVWNYRGQTFTETEANRMRAALGDKYESFHWDTVATDRKIIVLAPRSKLVPESDSMPLGCSLGHEIYWPLLNVDERPTSEPWVNIETPVPEVPKGSCLVLGRKISAINIKLIRTLPNPRFVGLETRDIAPVFFRFDGGVGAVMPLGLEPK